MENEKKEFKDIDIDLLKSEKELLNRTQEIAKLGGWVIDVNDLSVSWTDEVSRIHELPIGEMPKVEDGIKFYAPEAQPIIAAAVDEGIKNGTPWDLELPFITAKGNHIWVRAIGYPEQEDDKTVRLSGVFQDITENKQNKIKLEEVNTSLELFIEGTGAGIWDWININEEKEWWSPRFYELLGYDNEELEASVSNFRDILHPDDIDRTFAMVSDHFTHKVPFDIEYRLKTKNNGYKWFKGTGKALFNENGEPIRMVGSIIDISRQKESEKLIAEQINQLKSKNKELEQFVYVASHDLQEPLRTMSSYVGLLSKVSAGQLDDKTQRFLKHIEDASSRMKTLIKDLLDYSRLGREKEITKVDCKQLIDEILLDFELIINETQADIRFEKLPVIEGFEIELKQLFQNLISNGLKFRQENSIPKITIEVKDKSKHWLFSIKDNGIGIEKQHLERVFIIFQRLHGREAFEGTGIGLSLCKKIIEMHQGKIWIESKPEIGSIFYFTIPKKIKV